MITVDINFNDQELDVITLMVPGKTADEIFNIILRDWFNANVDRVYKTIKPQEQVLNDIATFKRAEMAARGETVEATAQPGEVDQETKV